MPLSDNYLRGPQMSLSISNAVTTKEKQSRFIPSTNTKTLSADSLSQTIEPNSIDDLTNEAIKSGFDPSIIGKHLLQIAERESPIELAIAYVAVVVKARRARMKRSNS